MKAYKNILYAIDLDDDNNAVTVYALEFARMFESRLHVVYVNDSQAGYRHPADHEDAIALRVKDAVPEALLEDADIVYAVAKGDAARQIVQYAEKNAVDLMIVGHKHRGHLYASLFDSTDVDILEDARIPVLVVPEL